MQSIHATSWRLGILRLVRYALVLLALCFVANLALAQSRSATGNQAAAAATAEKADLTAEQLQQLADDASANRAKAVDAKNAAGQPREMNFFQLLLDGGPLMIPLVLISILVLSVSLERLINLRSGRVMPRKLRRGL